MDTIHDWFGEHFNISLQCPQSNRMIFSHDTVVNSIGTQTCVRSEDPHEIANGANHDYTFQNLFNSSLIDSCSCFPLWSAHVCYESKYTLSTCDPTMGFLLLSLHCRNTLLREPLCFVIFLCVCWPWQEANKATFHFCKQFAIFTIVSTQVQPCHAFLRLLLFFSFHFLCYLSRLSCTMVWFLYFDDWRPRSLPTRSFVEREFVSCIVRFHWTRSRRNMVIRKREWTSILSLDLAARIET